AAEKAVADAKKAAEDKAAKDAADKAAADAVKARIAALPAEVTLDDEAAVAAARSAFDALTDDQKALVDNEPALKAAEAKLAELKNRPAENTFVDVKEGAFYYDAVAWAVANGITNGTDATHFTPAGECTRGQVVTFLWRAAGSPEPTSADNPFADVKEGKFYYNAVLWAVENGITNGTDATHFSPDATCTRGQVVTFQWRAAGSPAPQGSNNPFVDVKAGAFYENAVLWAVANGITNGTDATHFSPADTCTRGQVVTFLYRAK
ncbi:MAG: S-layer homology domain-containing protein, partial [Bacillota bacterium]